MWTNGLTNGLTNRLYFSLSSFFLGRSWSSIPRTTVAEKEDDKLTAQSEINLNANAVHILTSGLY